MKSFSELFADFDDSTTIVESENQKDVAESNDKDENPVEILRTNGIKIKTVIPTSFGVEIQLAKSYDENEIKKLLKNFKYRYKNNSIFVENWFKYIS